MPAMHLWSGRSAPKPSHAEAAEQALEEWENGEIGYDDEQQAKIENGKWNYRNQQAAKGTILDRRMKQIIQKKIEAGDRELAELYMPGKGEPGPDIVGTSLFRQNGWYDLITAGQWAQHVRDYAPKFGRGIGIIWS